MLDDNWLTLFGALASARLHAQEGSAGLPPRLATLLHVLKQSEKERDAPFDLAA